MSNAASCAIAVMAKAPRAGRVKTRLCPPLRSEEAQQLSAAFLRDITENLRLAAEAAPVHGFIAYAPAGEEALFDGILAPGTGLVLADGTIPPPPGVAGFGLCLQHAVDALFAQGFGAVCVLNADSPTLPTAILADLATRLLRPGRRAVLGPAEDGGYYALGLQSPQPRMFADIAWSTETVAAQTRARAAELDLPLEELPAWFDVDDRAALHRLLAEAARPLAAHRPYAAPATHAALVRLGLQDRLAGS